MAALDVGAHELHAHRIADVQAFEAPHQASLGERLQDAHPDSLVRGTRDHGVELRTRARFEQHGRGGLVHLPLHLRGIAFLLRAVCRELPQLLLAVGRGAARERGFHEPLRDEIREAAVGRGRVRVVIDCEPEMPLDGNTRALAHILRGAEELHDRQRQVREALRGGALLPGEKVAERGRVGRRRQALAARARKLHDAAPALRRAQHPAERGVAVALEELRHRGVGRDHEVFDELLGAVVLVGPEIG